MKKLLLLLLAISLAGCSNPINRKIDKAHFADDLKDIEQKNGDDYTQADFAVLTMMVGFMNATGTENIHGTTYKLILDTIKATRVQKAIENVKAVANYKKAFKFYDGQVAALAKDVSFQVIDKGVKANDAVGIGKILWFNVSILNSTGTPITAFKGTLVVSNIFGDELKQINITDDDGLDAGKTEITNEGIEYNEFDQGEVKIGETDISKLKFKWEPEEIIFKDGKTVKVPDEPTKPDSL
jgi:hypothetical protein